MPTNTLCESCPHATPEGFMKTILTSQRAQKKFERIMCESWTPAAQLRIFFISLVVHMFGKNSKNLYAQTVWEVHQCLESVWNLGNRGMNCQDHHMRHAYEAAWRWPLCLRKYMMEESISFVQWLWKESENNEEQFQALLRDRWPVHQMTFMC